ncbi:hypothetical protein QT972_15760 [Microcoleus sp. herbarium7]|uniref:hypothetical protein n=1 Tax=Microcoleus sp. herbarium7 TaxID=3055435 RepID=UPI002FD30B41
MKEPLKSYLVGWQDGDYDRNIWAKKINGRFELDSDSYLALVEDNPEGVPQVIYTPGSVVEQVFYPEGVPDYREYELVGNHGELHYQRHCSRFCKDGTIYGYEAWAKNFIENINKQ